MKKILLNSLAICLITTTVQAQSSDRKFALGINGGLSDYHGELNQQWFNFDKAFRGQLGLSGSYYLNPWFNLGLDATVGHVGHQNNLGHFRATMGQGNLNLRLKFNNGKWLKEDSKFQPYIFIGTGALHMLKDSNLNVPGTDWTGNAGAGFNIMFNEKIGLNYNLNYLMTNHDKRDNISSGKNDQFMIHTIGLVFTIGKIKDTDGDLVPDKLDKCPETPAGRKVNLMGCDLDTDNDGIADFEDACPTVAGTVATKGCPDSDKDGIVDSEDVCPTVFGVASAKGCPDTDGDGITDADDVCPKVKGTVAMKGCPDSDGDGIADAEDACPTVKGTVAMNGCPDTDGDGIADNVDKCPSVKGVAANNGCPEIKAETQKVFDQALKGVQFETSKAVIKPVSYGILDNVAKIMKDNPEYKLDINGHTDAQGDDAKNLTLSQERSASVKAYLVSKGVDASRMEPYGFGETQPKATNDTPAGRAENRRVEFKVRF